LRRAARALSRPKHPEIRYDAWLTDDMLKSGTRRVGIRADVK
jgi:hypothetical protein